MFSVAYRGNPAAKPSDSDHEQGTQMSATVEAKTPPSQVPSTAAWSRLWRRELAHYPTMRTRVLCLSIVVLTTILFYYQYYVISGVGDQVIASTGMSFMYFVNINVVSAFASAVTSILGGLTDRYGRANVVVVGVLGCALTCLIGFPLAHSALSVAVLYTVLGALEGVVLVATPALVRDFSPQLGRATAMGFWTIGPVAGSLVTSAVVSNTIDHVGAWQDEYAIAGWAGIGVFLIALFWLRELSPQLRDQLVVSEHEQVLAEAKARGIDVQKALERPYRQMLRVDILGSALAISLFLIVYYAAVGFFPIFFQTLFGFTTSQANALGNWMWGFQTVALILIGMLSDRLRVRKPFMIAGSAGAIVMTGLLIRHTSQPQTSYHTWVVILAVLAFFLAMAFAPWMAGFTETVERRNPALTATGLSLWGLIIRIVVTVVTFIMPYVISSATTLIQDGPAVQALAAGKDPSLTAAQNAAVKAVAADPAIVPKVQALATTYHNQLATAAKIDKPTQAALAANPDDQGAQVKALAEISGLSSAVVARAVQIDANYGAELATAGAIDPATQIALLGNPNDPAALQKAVQEIAGAFHVSPAQAQTRLAALAQVPTTDLVFMSANGAAVQKAVDQLTALGKVPAADLNYLDKYGTPLQDKKVQDKLKYLQDKGAKVQKAAADSPHQWQHYFWIALGGQILFVPLIFVMAGYWNPRRARRAAEEHEALVDAELAKLTAQRTASQ